MSKPKEMTLNELKKLVKGYDEFMSMKIPKGIKKPELIKMIQDKGYKIDHEKKVLIATFKQKTKKQPKKVSLPPPPSPEEVKKKKEAQEKRKKEKKKKDKDMRRDQINRGREIQKKIDMIQMKKKEKADQPKPKPKIKKPVKKEDPTITQALNNASSVVKMYEKQEGKLKDSDFTNRKELMEVISLIKKVLKDTTGLSQGKVNLLKKAVKLYNDKPLRLKVKKK
jgi:hypothetical protein